MNNIRRVSLFKNGRSQALRIPKEFELPGTEVTIERVGSALVVEPVAKRKSLVEAMDSFGPVGEDFPDIEDLPPEPFSL
jgi:antitoxin VapB